MHRSALFGCIYRAVFVYVWLSSSLTVQSGLRVLRVAVPKYRHAGTGTIFCILPTPSISHMLLIVGNWPAASWNGDLSEQITKGPEVFCQTTESWSFTYVQKRTKGIFKLNLVAQTALAVKTFLSVFLVGCHNWKAWFIKYVNKNTEATVLHRWNCLAQHLTRMTLRHFARNGHGIRCRALHLFLLYFVPRLWRIDVSFFKELCCDCLRPLSRCIKSDACHRVIKWRSFYCHATYTNVLCTLGTSRKTNPEDKAHSKAHNHMAEKGERVTMVTIYLRAWDCLRVSIAFREPPLVFV